MSDLETGIVLLLKSASRYLTRGEISSHVGAPAPEVAGAVDELRSRGYRIDEVPGQGYRLVDVPGVLDGCELRAAIGNRIIGREIFPFGQVTSTNDVAFSLARGGSPEGTLVIAEEQTRGKGRLGRVWHSPAGLGLWFSIVLRPGETVYHLPTVSLVVALAVAGVARDAYGVDARIKWPNDVLVRSRKLCGILTEAEFLDNGVEFIVVGVGLNVLHRESDFPDELRGIATSIAIESSVKVERVDAISRVLWAVENRYVDLCRKGFEGLRLDILPLSSLIGRLTRVETANGIIEGVAVDIDETGALILRRENGLNERVLAGDATLIQPGGP